MRKLIVLCTLLVSTAAFAQEKPNGLFVFVTDPTYTSSRSTGGRWDGAFGVALQRMFTPRFSGELSVSRQSDRSGFTTFNPDGTVLESHVFTRYSTPVDLTARYHFLNDSTWKPYAGIGGRWVDSRGFLDLTGGVLWQFRPSLGLRFDGKLLFGGQTRFDNRFNGSAGLTWRF